MSLSLLGIYREPEFSPGRHASNDALILRLVGQALEQLGVHVQLKTLEEARGHWQEADGIFSMCQGPEAISELRQWKKKGARIFNDPDASLATYRAMLCSLLTEHAVPFPRSVLFATDGSADIKFCELLLQSGAWLKRSTVHATVPQDVVRIRDVQELTEAFKAFHNRGLSSAILQENIVGDEVKFYAVREGQAPDGRRSQSGFFWPYYPKDSAGHPFDENQLKAIAENAARILNLTVYGGDAIISPNGTITLIDVNDWPSFAPCRGAAAFAIAESLKELYVNQDSRETARI